MAKAFGVRVITTVLTDEIAENIKHLNADRVVVTTKEDISLVLKEELEARRRGRAEDLSRGGKAVACARSDARDDRDARALRDRSFRDCRAGA